MPTEENITGALIKNQTHGVSGPGIGVRRLTPEECEKLQGFPSGWTAIPLKKKPASACPDGPRYKAIGNSMAVNCMNWIGRRLDAVDKKYAASDAAPPEPDWS